MANKRKKSTVEKLQLPGKLKDGKLTIEIDINDLQVNISDRGNMVYPECKFAEITGAKIEGGTPYLMGLMVKLPDEE